MIPFSYALKFYVLGENPTFNSDRRELGAKTDHLRRKRTIGVYVYVVLPSIWRRNIATVIERSQVSPTQKNKTKFNPDRKLGAEKKYLRRKRTIGVEVFVVLPSIWPRNFAAVIERSQVLLAQNKLKIQL